MIRTRCIRNALVSLLGLGLILPVGLSAVPIAAGGAAEPQAKAKPEGGESAKAPGFRLEIGGEVARPLKLSAAEWAAFPRKTVKARSHDGKESTYEGVPLFDLLSKAGAPMGQELRGKALGLYAVVEAADGYRAVFALPELDPAYTDRVVLLADRIDGQPLDAKSGPLRVIVPGEKKQARSVRQVIAIRVGRS